jgi:hypothetical protein
VRLFLQPTPSSNVLTTSIVFKRFLATVWFLAVFAVAALANAQPVPLWGRWEQTFIATNSAMPQTELYVDLTSPSDKVMRISGFWDGGLTWRARFMPIETGQWQYRTTSIPAINGLDGKTGIFVTQKEPGNNRFRQHGPIQVSPNGRFFIHTDGTPFFWIGDTVWYGAILSAKSDWETYLMDRENKGFNVVHFNAVAPRNGVAADENGEVSFEGADRYVKPNRISRIVSKGLTLAGLAHDKPITINPRFYQRLDQRVDAINAHGLLAAIVLTWGYRPEDSGNYLPEGEVVRLVQYLVARYCANQVVWILTGDNDYEGVNGERWKRIGRAAFGQRPHAPVTTHPMGMRWPWENFRDEKWLDFIIYQSGHGDDADTLRWIHSGPPRRHWQNPPPRPFINIEPPYEGHLGYQSRKPLTDYTTRRAIYWSLLNAPTAGVTYGAHGVWSWHTDVGHPPTDHPRTGIAKTWREALAFPGSTQMHYLEKFFNSIPWWTLQPDSELIAHQSGLEDSAAYVSAARSESGDLAVLYLPRGGQVEIRPSLLKNDLVAEWFDPRTGQRVSATKLRTIFNAPDQQDWVLVLADERNRHAQHWSRPAQPSAKNFRD